MNNLFVTFPSGTTELIIDNFDTNKNAITGIIIKGNVSSNTTISFSRQSNDENDITFYPYKDYNGNDIVMSLYSNAWIGLNPYIDLLSIINDKSKLKLILNQSQNNNIIIEFLFFVNVF